MRAVPDTAHVLEAWACKNFYLGPLSGARELCLNRRAGRVQAERDDVAERAVARRRDHAPHADDAALRHAACARTCPTHASA